jgi:integrase
MTIFKRGSIFYYDFILHGIRHAGTCRTKNRRAAEKVEADVRKREDGRSPEPGAITLGDAMKRMYTERWSRTKDHERTLARTERIVEMLGAETPLSAIDSPKISQMAATLRSSGLKDSSVNRYFATMKTLLITAQREWGAIPSIPYIKLAKEPTGRLRTFSVTEEEKIQQLLRGRSTVRGKEVSGLSTEAADLFLLLADTGMRLGEAVKLESRDVNLETGLIHVWENKGDRPRSIPLTARVRAMLTPRRERGGRIFQFTDGQQVEGVWRRCVRKQEDGAPRPEFADAVIHGYRHSYASRLVQLGVPLYSVQRLLGHSTLKMTERYAHLTPESFRQSAQLLDALVKSKDEART